MRQPKRRSTPPWINPACELPPTAFYEQSLLGTQHQLARWACHDGKSDPRRLVRMVQNGVIWARKHHTRLYELFFLRKQDYARAEERQRRDIGAKSPDCET
jgi:hypothetical protein